MLGLGDRVRAEREVKGWSQDQLAAEVTRRGFKIGQSAIGNIESGRVKEPKCIVQLAAALGVNPVWLREAKGEKAADASTRRGLPGFADPPEAPSTSRPLGTTKMMPVDLFGGARDIPVWASAQAGDDGAMVLTSEPIDYIRRSERMQGVKNPFAFYVIGTSMSPAIEHGDQVVVNPVLPVRPGVDCVFIHEDGNGTMLALVKRLLRSNADHWRVRQFNPPKDYDLPKTKWTRAYVVPEIRRGGL